MTSCHYCGTTTAELRPYGPGGSWTCYDCGMKPENEPTTRAAFEALLHASMAVSPVNSVVIGEETGPRPV